LESPCSTATNKTVASLMDSKKIPLFSGNLNSTSGKSVGSKLSNRQHRFSGFTANCQQTPTQAAVS
jgi:hypothetical protein